MSVLWLTIALLSVTTMLVIALSWLLYDEVRGSNLLITLLAVGLTAPFILYACVSVIRKLYLSEEKLRALSIMDDLTDVYNRRYILEQTEKELAKALRYSTSFSLMVIDIDRFKKINDTYGHTAGDRVLKALANTCMNNLRAMDIFARYGGEEFVFLIPESDKTDVLAFGEKIRHQLAKTEVIYQNCRISFTVSLGLKTFDESITSVETMLKYADDALYEAKRSGRDQVVSYDLMMDKTIELSLPVNQ